MGVLNVFGVGYFTGNPAMPAPVIHGDHITRRHYMQYSRYHLDMSIAPLKGP